MTKVALRRVCVGAAGLRAAGILGSRGVKVASGRPEGRFAFAGRASESETGRGGQSQKIHKTRFGVVPACNLNKPGVQI
jgi:hypothetical protein